MAEEEFRVEVELGSDEHGLSIWDRLRALGLDDDARKRLGSRVTVTRDGNRMLLYAHTLADALEAERTVKLLVADDHLVADYAVTQWNSDDQQWIDTLGSDPHQAADPTTTEAEEPLPDPNYVLLQRYKPEFLRDLGL